MDWPTLVISEQPMQLFGHGAVSNVPLQWWQIAHEDDHDSIRSESLQPRTCHVISSH